MDNTERIRELLDTLKKVHGSECIKVFGSAVDKKKAPRDLDAFLDMDVCNMSDEDIHKIALLQGEYEDVFEPYMRVGGKLFRAEGGRWLVSKNKDIVRAAVKGEPLHSINI